MLEQVEAGKIVLDLKMNILQAIQYIIQDWDKITADTIKNCWNHTKILSNSIIPDDINNDDLILDDKLARIIETLNLPNRMGIKELITIPGEEIVYEIPEVLEIADLFKSELNTNHPDELDNSIEEETICINNTLQSLKTVHMFLLQQENTSEQINLVGKIEKFIKRE
ncbi:unnamed protein product [Rhizophagus irregularis]|nr:hypothetical protein RhiirB3_427976 [Rhizophagus irregularis]CAB5395052.1 unnamed protein product [Rhizophagus irregularis]